MNMKKNISILLILFLTIIVTSCHKNDISQLSTGDCYSTVINDKELIIRIDDIHSGAISGMYYHTDCLLAEPHPFLVERKIIGWKLSASNLLKPVKVKWEMQPDQTIVRCKSSRLPQEFELKNCTANDPELFHRQLCDSTYRVKVSTDIQYAKAYGYWTSYPDEDKPMVKILAELYKSHVSDLKEMQEHPLLMDIYEPIDNDSLARHPLILFIHGGAFLNGDKQDEPYIKWCRHFASLGYVAVSINYRMGFLPYKKAVDCAGYRATQDANAALRYLVQHADDYHINPDMLFSWGTSAGAITALNVAFMNNSSRPSTVMNEGDIDKLAPECPTTFHVRAVANMWGAVLDTTILANSRTAVVSFHSDGDNIIPYHYGYPFKEWLISSVTDEVNDVVYNVISFFGASSNRVNHILDQTRSFLDPITGLIEPFTRPAWNMIVSPMYGSAPIHEYLTRHGVRSKLFTEHKPKVHSLHVDDHRKIISYFYTIQDSVAQFFFSELVPNPVFPQHESLQSQYFRIDNADVKEAHWYAEGGMVLESSDNCAKVVFFRDAALHVVRVCGKYKNGLEFCEEMAIS